MDALTRERYPDGIPWAEGPGTPPYIVCGGRDHDDRGQPVGDPCGAKVSATRFGTAVQVARAAGWAVGPNGDGMCPSCRRPDPRTTAAVRR